jgi:circadian clock protein KaiC
MATTQNPIEALPLLRTGINGLDYVLAGGLTANRLYLVEGVPGAGKTTLALQFLIEGAKNGEPVLYVTLSETEEELRAVARSHGWDLDGVHIREVIPSGDNLQPDQSYTVFHPSEVELSDTTQTILAEVDRIKPTRVVFDSLSELRLLAGNALRYRRQVLALKQFFAGRRCTVLLLDDRTAVDHDLQVQSIAHGVILLDQTYPDYGAERRRVRVIKYRGVSFRGGFHDFQIRRGGLEVFERIVASDTRSAPAQRWLSSGVAAMDSLLGGGLEGGSSTLIVGAAGTGKSSIAAKFAAEAAARGERAALFLFDESPHMLLNRMDGLNIDLRRHAASGQAMVQQIDPAELSPGEFAHRIRAAADENVTLLVIDSLNGYLNAMPEERFLTAQLHELLTYLGQRGVATIMVAVQHGLIGTAMVGPVDASYLADAIIMMRYFEAEGEVRQALSVVKKRGGNHERTIREFKLGAPAGINIGEPLRDFHGVLTGVPQFKGKAETLLKPPKAET